MGRLLLKPLTAEAFAPFGEVIEVRERDTARQINEGLTARYHDLARVEQVHEAEKICNCIN